MNKQKIEKSNRIGTYLAVTAGVGCAASAASGAIQVVDLSGLSTSLSFSPFAIPGGDLTSDLRFTSEYYYGKVERSGDAIFYSTAPGTGGSSSYARGYQPSGVDVPFGLSTRFAAAWLDLNGSSSNHGGFVVGTNWVAFKDSANRYGWMSFELNSLEVNDESPLSSYGVFVYDDTSTSPATAISLNTAVAAAAVPEPSGLALLALGSIGLAARRRRKN